MIDANVKFAASAAAAAAALAASPSPISDVFRARGTDGVISPDASASRMLELLRIEICVVVVIILQCFKL